MRIKLMYPFVFVSLLGLALAAVLTAGPAAAGGGLCYVNGAAAGGATGLDWTNAYTTVQDALTNAACTEIWVAKGVYYPDEGNGQTNDNRGETFTLKNGVALYGGFAGTETQRDQRDPAANVTVLSGDIEQNDITDANEVVTTTANINGNNAYHVVSSNNVDSTAVLDGFTITAGNASASLGYSRGGGMYSVKSSPTLANLVFSGNKANSYGGGLYNQGSTPTITNTVFIRNRADADGGGIFNSGSSAILTNTVFMENETNGNGGGVHNNGNSNAIFYNVTFIRNKTTNGEGGGVFNIANQPRFTNVTFISNTANGATSEGGGLSNNDSAVTLVNVTFSGNSAVNGGGIANTNGSSPSLINVTISGNSASGSGGGMYNINSSPALTNTLIANSSAGGDCVNDTGGSIASGSTNNLIEDDTNACGLTNGSSNNIIGQDPNLGPLTDFGGPGEWVFPLLSPSPAIDTGTACSKCPATDQRGVSRPAGAAYDIGAYEAAAYYLYLPAIMNSSN